MLSRQAEDLRSQFSTLFQHPHYLASASRVSPASCPRLHSTLPKSIRSSRLRGGDYRNMDKGITGDYAKYFAQPGQKQSSSPAKSTGSPRHAIATAPLAYKSTTYNAYETESSDDDSDCSGSDPDSPRSYATSNSSLSSDSEDHLDPRTLLERQKQIVDSKKQELVDRVMARFYAFFSPWIEAKFGIECYDDGGRGECSGSNGGGGSNRAGGSGGPGGSNGSTGRGEKRQRRDSDGGGEDRCGSEDEGKGGRRGNTKRLRRDSRTRRHAPRFACPFYKYDQKRYGKVKTCCGPGWEAKDLHRLKEHAFRRHSAPEHMCNRCLVDFETDKQLVDHQRAVNICATKTPDPDDMRLTKDKIDKLKAKFKSGLSAREKWERIYQICFPDAEIPQNPYYEDDVSKQELFGEFLSREVPSAMRRNIEARIKRPMQAIEKEFCGSFEATFKQAFDTACRTWREQNQQAAEPQSGASAAKSMAKSPGPPSPSTETTESLSSPGDQSYARDISDFEAQADRMLGSYMPSMLPLLPPTPMNFMETPFTFDETLQSHDLDGDFSQESQAQLWASPTIAYLSQL